MVDSDFFAANWPTTERQLRALLLSRGHQSDDVDDVTQWTAEQALRHPPFDDLAHFTAWCVVVAKNKSADLHRRCGREILGEVPDGRPLPDVADTVAARLTNEALVASIAKLPSGQRSALFATSNANAPRREVVRLAVARHRARQKLLAMLEGFAAFVGRWHTRLLQRLGDTVEPVVAAAGVAAATLVAVGVVVTSLVQGPSQPERRRVPSPTSARATLPVIPVNSQSSGQLGGADATRGRATDRGLHITVGHDEAGNRQGVDIAPRKPHQTRFACVGQTPVSPEACMDSPVEKAQKLVGEILP